MGGKRTADSDSDESSDLRRRSVLQAVGAAAGAGLVGAGAVGPASADPTALELTNCATVWESAPAEFPQVDVRESEPTTRNLPAEPEEVVFYYVGWTSEGQIADDQAYTLEQTLEANGYDHPVVTVQWESDTILFSTGEDNADRDGRRFADFLREYHADNPDTTIRLAGLSLGGRPPLATLDDLDGDVPVETVSLFGASVDDNEVCDDDSATFSASAIEATADRVYNYHSREDNTICVFYELQTFRDGMGCVGIDCRGWFSDDSPANWVDVDVTDEIDSHCNYQVPEVGIGDRIAADLRSSD
ncbi:hypothetical protein [Halorientalis halophila]|uniref:hypothetical protein n=1 Tax=Halorientalis halophila TaxID=3108499 RepID=UPI00300BDF20